MRKTSPLIWGDQLVGWPVATSNEKRWVRTIVVLRAGFWMLWKRPPAYITEPTWLNVWTAPSSTTASSMTCGVVVDGTADTTAGWAIDPMTGPARASDVSAAVATTVAVFSRCVM